MGRVGLLGIKKKDFADMTDDEVNGTSLQEYEIYE